jgi:polyhydroxyalkanoate synthesis regulator phasin
MNIEQLALQAQQLQKDLEAGNISNDEYKELVSNIGLMQAINSETAQLEENIMYREIIVNAINLASALA